MDSPTSTSEQDTITTLTANLGAVRREQVNGRDFLVAPLTMIVPGVLPGSKGPLYYPPEEIGRNPDGWNGMPIVVNHPVVDGRNVSARSPRILEKYGIGHVYAANVTTDGKLVGEGWFDVAATRRVDARVYDDLVANRPIELSTGLFTRNDPVRNGKCPKTGADYTHVARDYRQDHLAILPDTKGACSLRDGCGVLVNQKNYGFADADVTGMLAAVNADERAEWSELAAVINKLPDMSPEKACKILHDGSVMGHKLTRQQQNMFGALCGKSPTSNEDIDHMALTTVTRTEGDTVTRDQTITHLTTNCDCYKGKADALKLLPDDVLANMKANADKAGRTDELELIVNAGKNQPPSLTAKPKTAAEWYADAPPEIQEIVRNAKEVQDEAKATLVEKIVTANARTKEAQDAVRPVYEAMSLPTLKTLAANLPEPTDNHNPFTIVKRQAYAGSPGTRPTVNAGKGKKVVQVPADDDEEFVDNSLYPVPLSTGFSDPKKS